MDFDIILEQNGQPYLFCPNFTGSFGLLLVSDFEHLGHCELNDSMASFSGSLKGKFWTLDSLGSLRDLILVPSIGGSSESSFFISVLGLKLLSKVKLLGLISPISFSDA